MLFYSLYTISIVYLCDWNECIFHHQNYIMFIYFYIILYSIFIFSVRAPTLLTSNLSHYPFYVRETNM